MNNKKSFFRKINKLFLILLSIAVLTSVVITSCQKEDDLENEISQTEEDKDSFNDGMIKLGEKLENPYSVENMKKAYENLKANNTLKSSNIDDITIKTTHYYVRFLPKTKQEYALLIRDTTLLLFDFPLDYEMEEGGTYYHDPELPEAAITWQYCSVKKDYQFHADIKYEILEELFLPEESESNTLKNSKDWTFCDDLEIEALRITGNLDESDLKSTNKRKKWKPSGTIQMYDNTPSVAKLEPLNGVKVIARSWFTSKEDITSTTGYFKIEHNFRGNVNYVIKWERNDFELRDKRWGQAYYNGPRTTRSWNLNIYSGMSRMYAIIHRAAPLYYYEYRKGLKSPPRKHEMLGRITIGAYDWNNGEDNGNFSAPRRWGTFPEIKIYKPQRFCHEIFSSTIHELAHSVHWELGGHYNYLKTDIEVKESWCRGVQWELTKLEYHALSSGLVIEHYQTKTIGDKNVRKGYTPLVVDLIDSRNQGAKTGSIWTTGKTPTNAFVYKQNIYYMPVNSNQCPVAGSWFDGAHCFLSSAPTAKANIFTVGKDWHIQVDGLPVDRVSGYTIVQIQNALKGARTLTEWKNNLKKQTSNSTEPYLDELFANYTKIKYID